MSMSCKWTNMTIRIPERCPVAAQLKDGPRQHRFRAAEVVICLFQARPEVVWHSEKLSYTKSYLRSARGPRLSRHRVKDIRKDVSQICGARSRSPQLSQQQRGSQKTRTYCYSRSAYGQSVTFTVAFRSGGVWERGLTVRDVASEDGDTDANQNPGCQVDGKYRTKSKHSSIMFDVSEVTSGHLKEASHVRRASYYTRPRTTARMHCYIFCTLQFSGVKKGLKDEALQVYLHLSSLIFTYIIPTLFTWHTSLRFQFVSFCNAFLSLKIWYGSRDQFQPKSHQALG